MSAQIEVEVRSFITDQQYAAIRTRLDREFEFRKELNETTVYFAGEKDLRMRKNEDGAFVILKEGKIHDDYRKEFEIGLKPEDFDCMAKLFSSLGYEIEIEWRRRRREYHKWGMKVLLDDTAGYQEILELEKMAEEGREEAVHAELAQIMQGFGIEDITSKEEFDRKYEDYKQNWKGLITNNQ
jgi:predicted adenylyl cyclase CyaB